MDRAESIKQALVSLLSHSQRSDIDEGLRAVCQFTFRAFIELANGVCGVSSLLYALHDGKAIHGIYIHIEGAVVLLARLKENTGFSELFIPGDTESDCIVGLAELPTGVRSGLVCFERQWRQHREVGLHPTGDELVGLLRQALHMEEEGMTSGLS